MKASEQQTPAERAAVALRILKNMACNRDDYEAHAYLRESVELRGLVEQGWNVWEWTDGWQAAKFTPNVEIEAPTLPELLAAIRAEEADR